jgi:hypothetical protein
VTGPDIDSDSIFDLLTNKKSTKNTGVIKHHHVFILEITKQNKDATIGSLGSLSLDPRNQCVIFFRLR